MMEGNNEFAFNGGGGISYILIHRILQITLRITRAAHFLTA
ncbi:hypothetical protein HH_0503 [Helicobacter hepaticus ATCC 51449]|uniref:Uncharacterized protein n=1 Tax=Helicobacter hepaticus (strain ATCC 51449 / 3B1) TaxID=235279 RepID=Q7VIV1_HELHP|nr:hypothetical protein HH_0503 [Helicobacter hepaticus ATCC 51449]